MKSIIIYGSHYGTTKSYAEELSKITNIEAISFEKYNNHKTPFVSLEGFNILSQRTKEIKALISNKALLFQRLDCLIQKRMT